MPQSRVNMIVDHNGECGCEPLQLQRSLRGVIAHANRVCNRVYDNFNDGNSPLRVLPSFLYGIFVYVELSRNGNPMKG